MDRTMQFKQARKRHEDIIREEQENYDDEIPWPWLCAFNGLKPDAYDTEAVLATETRNPEELVCLKEAADQLSAAALTLLEEFDKFPDALFRRKLETRKKAVALCGQRLGLSAPVLNRALSELRRFAYAAA